MSLDQTNVIDAIGTEHDGTVVLSIIDGLDWSDPEDHLAALQDKLNTYLGFVEAGELFIEYPSAENHHARIELVSRLPIPDEAVALLKEADRVAAQLDVRVTQRIAVVD
jgi:hypothetical protein